MLLAKKSDSLFEASLKTIGALFLAIFLGLLLDSKFVIPYFPQGQIVANIVVAIIFLLVFIKSTQKIREFLIYAILIAIAGECFFSLLLEMYTYRLQNVPMYVFFGHALLYVSVLYFCKANVVKVFRNKLELFFIVIIIAYAALFLIFKSDIFGFILTAFTLLILMKRPRERFFYLTMYLCVVFLEIVGTWYDCWYWPKYALNLEDTFLKSANPPSGISFFYFGLDLGSLYFYKLRHKIAWKRMKNIRTIRITSRQIICF
ncbi:hypothetical protein [Moheibacter sediminis]|uniref:Uncharacterized protein n=1 Tax=Moheibacter sediminis TaxID=1434700 RepID=A0A1W1ZD27_9FLAO|nr:hypothetical protein [Moheibacter sediminis]SMC46339.1 hypothetical protein SAMN06296427_102403 [Moheibacter sediminis]